MLPSFVIHPGADVEFESLVMQLEKSCKGRWADDVDNRVQLGPRQVKQHSDIGYMVDVMVRYENPSEAAQVQPCGNKLADRAVSTVNERHLVIDEEGM
jgi:hypothetical protein